MTDSNDGKKDQASKAKSKNSTSKRSPPPSVSPRITRSQTLASRMQKDALGKGPCRKPPTIESASVPSSCSESTDVPPTSAATQSSESHESRPYCSLSELFEPFKHPIPEWAMKDGRQLNFEELMALVYEPSPEPPISEVPWGIPLFASGSPPVSVLQQKPVFNWFPGSAQRVRDFWREVNKPAYKDPMTTLLKRTSATQEQSSPPLSDRKGKSVVLATPTAEGKAKQPKRGFFGMNLLAGLLGSPSGQQPEELDSNKENSPASLSTVKPLVAHLPTFRENVEPITRRHTDGHSQPYSPKRLQKARRAIKSAEVNRTNSDWFKKNKSSRRDLTPIFQALARKQC